MPGIKLKGKTKAKTMSQDEAKNEKMEPSKKTSTDTASTKKFADGTKGIKTKKGGMIDFIHGEADKIKGMSDEELTAATKRNMNYKSLKQNKVEQALLDETVNRKWKKQGGYATGTKGIKTKKSNSKAVQYLKDNH